MFNRKYIFKGSIFHCYVSLPECIVCFGHLYHDARDAVLWIGDAPRPPGSLVVNTMPCSELMVGEVDNMGHDWLSQVSLGSMYGIFTYIYQENQPNVDKYTIHGWYGVCWPESAWWVNDKYIYIYIYSHIWKIPETHKGWESAVWRCLGVQ